MRLWKKIHVAFFLHKKWVEYSHRVGLPPAQSVIGVESHYTTSPISHWISIPSGPQPSGWITPVCWLTHITVKPQPKITLCRHDINVTFMLTICLIFDLDFFF